MDQHAWYRQRMRPDTHHATHMCQTHGADVCTIGICTIGTPVTPTPSPLSHPPFFMAPLPCPSSPRCRAHTACVVFSHSLPLCPLPTLSTPCFPITHPVLPFHTLFPHHTPCCPTTCRGHTKETRGTAYVVYEDIYDAKNACDHLSGFNVANRYLIVLYYNPQRTNKKVGGAGRAASGRGTGMPAIGGATWVCMQVSCLGRMGRMHPAAGRGVCTGQQGTAPPRPHLHCHIPISTSTFGR